LGISCLFLFACGGGGGGAGTTIASGAPAAVGFTVQDAGVDTFSKVDIRLTSIKLFDANGVGTANLLDAPRRFDFLGLSIKQALLALVPSVPAGSYTEVEMMVDAVDVLDLSGAPVVSTLQSAQARASLTALGGPPLVFDAANFSACSLDIDLDNSFTEDGANPGQFLFDLRFTASTDVAPALDEFRATVTSIDRPRSRFTARLLDDSATGGSFGSLEVVVADGDFLVHDDGRTFATADAFLDELDAGTNVQISGSLQPNGVFDANRVVEEDDGPSGRNRIEIEGEVRSIDTGAKTFTLLVKEVEKGAATAGPVLAGLADPNLITISYDANTLIVGEDANSSGPGLVDTTLIPGMEVDVRFATFAAPEPFPASSIEVGDGRSGADDGIEYEGVCSDDSGLPLDFQLTLDNSEPAVLTGLVTAPVTVSLASAPTIFLDAGPEPPLAADDILVNQVMKVYGMLSGPAGGATLVPNKIKVKPGELEGTLTAVDLGASTVTVTIDRVKRPFGGAANPSGSVVIAVATTAHVETDNGGTALVDLAGLLGGSPVMIKLEGIADGSGSLTAWDIEED